MSTILTALSAFGIRLKDLWRAAYVHLSMVGLLAIIMALAIVISLGQAHRYIGPQSALALTIACVFILAFVMISWLDFWATKYWDDHE